MLHFRQQFVQRQPARIVRPGVPMQLPATRHLPLIGGIEVDAHDVQVLSQRRPVPGACRPAIMSHASNWLSRCAAAGPVSHGRHRGGTLWISGSGNTIRAPGSTDQMASIAASAARTSCRFSSPSFPWAYGNIRSRVAAHAKNEISFTGE